VEATAQIFLSYAREDKKEVEELYQKLSGAGFKPWMDKEDILAGERWRSRIQRAIKRSDFFLACLSEDSIDKRGVLQWEIKQALDTWQEKLDSDIYLIPVRLEDCEVPESLREFHWVDLFEEDGWARLLEAIRVGMERRGKAIQPFQEPVPFEPYPAYEEPSPGAEIEPTPKKNPIKVWWSSQESTVKAALIGATATILVALNFFSGNPAPEIVRHVLGMNPTSMASAPTATSTSTLTPISTPTPSHTPTWTPTSTATLTPTQAPVSPTVTPEPPTATKTPTHTPVPPTAKVTDTPRPPTPTPTPVPIVVPQPAGSIALTIYLRDTLTETRFAALSDDRPNGGMIYEEGQFVYGEAAVQIGDTVYHFDKPEVGPGEPEQLPDPWRVEFEFAEELVARTGNQKGFDSKKARFWVGRLDGDSAIDENNPYSLTMKLYEGDALRKSIQVFFAVADALGVGTGGGPGGKTPPPP